MNEDIVKAIMAKTGLSQDAITALVRIKKMLSNISGITDSGAMIILYKELCSAYRDKRIIRYLDTYNYFKYLSVNECEIVLGDIMKMLKNMEINRDLMNEFECFVEIVEFTGLWSVFARQIEILARDIIEMIDKLEISSRKIYEFREFLWWVKYRKLMNKLAPQIEALAKDLIKSRILIKDIDPYSKAALLHEILSTFTSQIEAFAIDAIEFIINMEDSKYKLDAFRDLVNLMKNARLLGTFSSPIEALTKNIIKLVNDMEDSKNKLKAFRELLDLMNATGLLKEIFPMLFSDLVMNVTKISDKIAFYRELVRVLKETELWSILASQIEYFSIDIIKEINVMEIADHKKEVFRYLLGLKKGVKLKITEEILVHRREREHIAGEEFEGTQIKRKIIYKDDNDKDHLLCILNFNDYKTIDIKFIQPEQLGVTSEENITLFLGEALEEMKDFNPDLSIEYSFRKYTNIIERIRISNITKISDYGLSILENVQELLSFKKINK